MFITYRVLKDWIQGLTDEQLDLSATILDSSADELMPVVAMAIMPEDGRLDSGHPTIIV